jgi:hypothetical protein
LEEVTDEFLPAEEVALCLQIASPSASRLGFALRAKIFLYFWGIADSIGET